MIVAISGHRPEKIKDPEAVKEKITNSLISLGANKVIQGMAAGVDLWSAEITQILGLELVCARPWAGHAPRKADQEAYERAIRYAKFVIDIDTSYEYPGPWVYQKRNEWMVNHANATLAIWDGSDGGTANCVKYAQKLGRQLVILSPDS